MKKDRIYERGDQIYVFVPPRTIRRYYVTKDGDLMENNHPPKPTPTIKTPVQVIPPAAKTEQPLRIQDDPTYRQMYEWATGVQKFRRPND